MLVETQKQEPNVIAKTEKAKNETLPLWTADWDDEDIGEDFIVKLKREQQKMAWHFSLEI